MIGRKSGRTISIPVWFVLEGDAFSVLGCRGLASRGSSLPLDQFFPPDQLQIVAIPYLAPIGVLFVGNSVEFYTRSAAVIASNAKKGKTMGKTVLVTGSSSGIGRATAKLFAARGWNVAATARNPASFASWEQTNNIMVPKLDVNDESTIVAAVAATIHRFGTIDVVVNNAGYGVFGPLEGVSAEQLERQFQTNVFGAAAVIRHVLPIMRQRRSGTIINVSSIAGRIAGPFQSAYHGTKYALEGLSESLRFELKPHGIRVKLVEPAHFKTDFIARSLQWAEHSAYEPQLGNLMAWVSHSDENAPSPEPVAETIFKAATDSSERLRYPVKGRLFLVLHAILPDAIWRSMISAGMNRRPKS